MRFFKKYPLPPRHDKYKVINFAPSKKSIVANKLPSGYLEQFLRRIKSPLTRQQREIYRALIVPTWQSLNSHNFTNR